MSLIVACTNCASKLKVNDTAIGRKVRCPKCGDAVPVQDPQAAPTSAEPASPRPAAPRPAKRANDDDEEAPRVRKKRPPDQDAEADSEGYAPEESDTPSEEDRPRKKKKKKKKRRQVREKAGVPGWVWWAAGVCSLCLVFLIGAILLVQAGHGLLVLAFAINLPISAVILIVAMILSSALGGGIYFGELGEVLVRSLVLLLIFNAVLLIPFVGGWIGLLVLLIGSMVLFDLDVWEARFFIFINWALNFGVKLLLIGILLHAITHGRQHDDADVVSAPPPAVSSEELKILDDIKAKGGDYEFDDNEASPTVASISLEGKAIKDADLANLKIFKKLVSLDLPSTQVTDAGLDHVKELTSLIQLDLSGTLITDKGMAKLKGLKQLQALNIGGTKVTRKGIQDLQKALPALHIISQQMDRQNQRRGMPNRPFP
ncbi:MAG TPA: hypothetical protein VGY66_19070 [Gemmataceae bacterium]|jgi:hypothetical protein|nr:hypothetical protein [Gemmataceae bacterium]